MNRKAELVVEIDRLNEELENKDDQAQKVLAQSQLL